MKRDKKMQKTLQPNINAPRNIFRRTKKQKEVLLEYFEDNDEDLKPKPKFKNYGCCYNYKPEYEAFRPKRELNLTPWAEDKFVTIDDKLITDFVKTLGCEHRAFTDHDTSDIICTKCLTIFDRVMVNEENHEDKVPNSNLQIWERGPDKGRWTNYTMDFIQGRHNHELTDQLWLSLAREVPDPFTWLDIYKVFHKYKVGHDKFRVGVSDHWMGFGVFFQLPSIVNKKILYYADKYKERKLDKYAVNFNFLLYKFTQLFGDIQEQEKFIPLKGSKKWCEKMDLWWLELCLEEGFDYEETVIYKIHWNKTKVISGLVKCLKSMGMGTDQEGRNITQKEYKEIFGEVYVEPDRDTDEIEMKWKGNELVFINMRTKVKCAMDKKIKAYRYFHNGEWKFFKGKTKVQVPEEEYRKILQIN